MKKSDLKALINECIHEVLAEDNNIKKQEAIKEIKRIIAENDLNEEDLEEIDIKGAIGKVKDFFAGIPSAFKGFVEKFKSKISPDLQNKVNAELEKTLADKSAEEIKQIMDKIGAQLKNIGAKPVTEAMDLASTKEYVKANLGKILKTAGITLGITAAGSLIGNFDTIWNAVKAMDAPQVGSLDKAVDTGKAAIPLTLGFISLALAGLGNLYNKKLKEKG